MELIHYDNAPLLELLVCYYAVGPLSNYMYPIGPLQSGKGVITFADGTYPADLTRQGRLRFHIPSKQKNKDKRISCDTLDMYNILTHTFDTDVESDRSCVLYKGKKINIVLLLSRRALYLNRLKLAANETSRGSPPRRALAEIVKTIEKDLFQIFVQGYTPSSSDFRAIFGEGRTALAFIHIEDQRWC